MHRYMCSCGNQDVLCMHHSLKIGFMQAESGPYLPLWLSMDFAAAVSCGPD